MNKRNIFIFSLCALIALLILALMISHQSDKNRFSVKPKNYALAGNNLTIPQNYLATLSEEGTADYLSLKLVLPEFEPRTPENVKYLADIKLKRAIEIQLWPAEGRLQQISNDKYITSILEMQMRSKIHTWEKPKKLENGMTVYKASGGTGWLTDFYLWSEKGRKVKLDCAADKSDSKPPNPLCKSQSIIWNNVELTYWYPKQHLPNAISIHQKVMGLLEKLKTDAPVSQK